MRSVIASLFFTAALLAGSAQAQTTSSGKMSAAGKTTSTTAMPAATGKMGTASTAGLLDINSATEEQLDALKGLGPTRAAAIIKGRPFKGKDDLVDKKILPKSVYDKIKNQIIAKQK